MVPSDFLKAISSADFELSQPALKVIFHEHARRFCRLVLAGSTQEFVLSWRSDSVEPVVVPYGVSEVWLGVDERLACVTRDGRIALSIGLASPLLNILGFRHCVAVLCATEVIIFNTDHSVRKIHGLRDMVNHVVEDGGKLFAILDDADREVIG